MERDNRTHVSSVAELLKIRQRGFSLLNKIIVDKSTIQSAAEVIESLEHNLSVAQNDLSSNRTALETARRELGEKSAILQSLTEQKDESERRLSSALADIESLTRRLDELREAVASSKVTLPKRCVVPLGRHEESADHASQAKRRVLLVGWYGAQNFGDELMLKCMIDRYSGASADPKPEVSVLIEKNDGYRFLNIPDDVQCFYPPETESDLTAACSYFDEIVLGGGAHIDDAPIKNFDFIPYLIVRLSLKALELGKTVRWVAASSNRKLTDPDYIRAVQKIAREAATFSVRDAFSFASLEKAGITNVTIERDIAFDVEAAVTSHEKIALVALVSFAEKKFLPQLVNDLFNYFKERTTRTGERWRLCFLPFYLENACDRSLYEKLLAQCHDQGVPHFIAEEIENVETMLMLFRTVDLVVSMRYHASLLADVYGVPNLALCPDAHRHYFNKVHALAASYPDICRLIDVSAYSKEAFSTNLRALADMSSRSTRAN